MDNSVGVLLQVYSGIHTPIIIKNKCGLTKLLRK